MKHLHVIIGLVIFTITSCDVVQKKDLELITEAPPKVVKVDSVELNDTIPHVKIGVQVWMKNNVEVDKFSDGREIKKVRSIKDWIKYNERHLPCCYLLKSGTYLYNAYVLLDSISICPPGYRLPVADDYLMLAAYLGGREQFTEKVMTKLAAYDWSVEDWNESTQSLYDRKISSNNKSGFGATKGGYLMNGELNEGDCSFIGLIQLAIH